MLECVLKSECVGVGVSALLRYGALSFLLLVFRFCLDREGIMSYSS